MECEHHSFCKDWLDPGRQTVEIWDIPDVGPQLVDDAIGSSIWDDYRRERNASINLAAQEFFLPTTPALARHHSTLSEFSPTQRQDDFGRTR
jgi:hypothetical protein